MADGFQKVSERLRNRDRHSTSDLKRGFKAETTPAAGQKRPPQHQAPSSGTDSNWNPINCVSAPSPPLTPTCIVLAEEEVESTDEANSLELHGQNESYHWCEEDDLTSSDAATSTEKALASSDSHHCSAAEEYVEQALKADTQLAQIDMEDYKSADLFQSEQIRSLLIEYRQQQRNSQQKTVSRSQSPLSQDDCSLTDCSSLCKSGPLFSPQRVVVPKTGSTGCCPSDFSTDSLNLMEERDECWLFHQEEDENSGASQLLCRTNVTNYTLAWSSASGGTDQDLDFNEPGTSSSGSGSEQSRDWSSSGSGGMRVAPPIPPWPVSARNGPAAPPLQCWVQHSANNSNAKQSSPVAQRKSRKDDSATKKSKEASLSDVDNGNGKTSRDSSSRSRQRPVFTEAKTTAPPSSGLSLLQIYMRQRSQTSLERDKKKSPDDIIASGGGEGWVEEYPSSADEKLGLESTTSSLLYEDNEEEDEVSDDDGGEDCGTNARSLTLTDVSDIDQTSMAIDAVPFNQPQGSSSPGGSCGASSSLDKLLAKIKPFELGLSPASIEDFEGRMNRAAQDKSCQVAIKPSSSATQEESTSTEPLKPEAYLIFPSYSLPDLSFLKQHDYTWIGDVLLSPQTLPTTALTPKAAPSPPLRSFDELKKRQMGHVKDWESLKILLPEEIRQQINSAQPKCRPTVNKPRPKSCDHTVVLRNTAKKASQQQRPVSAWEIGLPTVPQSPPEGPPPLPKRTASLPHSPTAVRHRRQMTSPAVTTKTGVVPDSPSGRPTFGYTMRKTVSFGEHLSGGFLKSSNQKRPLSLSHWSGGGSLDIDSADSDTSVSVNLEEKQELVRGISTAASQLCKIMTQPALKKESAAHLVSRCLTGQLSPAIYQLLSDGLMPNVNTFFGQVTNSVWRVVEASVKKSPMLPWIEELVFCLNSEESLPEGPVRFGVFVTELVNMGGLEWWLDNLSTKETILRRHYAPHGFLYLCHTSTRPLMEQLRTSLRPLASLPFDHSPPSGGSKQVAPRPVTASPLTPPSPTKTILKSPARSTPQQPAAAKAQRPLSYVQSSPKTSPKPQYRRTQSQHSGLSPKKGVPTQQDQPVKEMEEFKSIKQKWESMCGDKKPVERAKTAPPLDVKSRIPRPVFRSGK